MRPIELGMPWKRAEAVWPPLRVCPMRRKHASSAFTASHKPRLAQITEVLSKDINGGPYPRMGPWNLLKNFLFNDSEWLFLHDPQVILNRLRTATSGRTRISSREIPNWLWTIAPACMNIH
jgi:hypothetical protein